MTVYYIKIYQKNVRNYHLLSARKNYKQAIINEIILVC